MSYDLGTYGEKNDGVDGSYGEKTEKAVKRFQSFAQIEVDGKYGSITHKALMGVLDDITKGENDGADDDDTPVIPAGKHVVATGDSVNVRSGPATTYKVLTRVNKGDIMPYVATAEALGWHAVEINGKIGWTAASTPKSRRVKPMEQINEWGGFAGSLSAIFGLLALILFNPIKRSHPA